MPEAADDTLPLLEALLSWSDARLIEAVRAQERRLTPYQLSGLVHRPRLSKEEELRRPGDADWMGGPANLGPVIAAWQELERAFKRAIVREDLFLTGVTAAPIRDGRRVPIAGVWAAEFEFDLLTDSLASGDVRYTAVQVSRKRPEATVEMATTFNALPLREAALAWCDPVLVAAVHSAERPRDLPRHAALWDVYDDLPSRQGPPQQRYPTQSEAWMALARDLRARIEAGEIELSGVLMKPVAQATRSTVPAVWAAVLAFSFEEGIVQAEGHRYVDVRGRRPARHPFAPIALEPNVAAAEAQRGRGEPGNENAAAELPATERKRRDSGRKPFPLEEMVGLAIELGGADWPNHKAAAHALRDAFEARYPDRQPPAVRTIFDHVPEIYRQRAAQRRSVDSVE